MQQESWRGFLSTVSVERSNVEETLMSGLFEEADRLESIPIPDGEIYYLSDLDLGRDPAQILQQLVADVPWRHDNILVWGKIYLQPRLIAWFGDRGSDYTYSCINLTPLPWTALLLV